MGHQGAMCPSPRFWIKVWHEPALLGHCGVTLAGSSRQGWVSDDLEDRPTDFSLDVVEKIGIVLLAVNRLLTPCFTQRDNSKLGRACLV